MRAQAFADGDKRRWPIEIHSNSDLVSTIRVTQSGSDDCRPAEGEVVVFTDTSYFGKCARFSLGDYPEAFPRGGVGDDATSSIRVGTGVIAELCRNPEFFGRCTIFTADATHFVNTDLGDNHASAVSVRRPGTVRCEPGAGEAALYIHADYRGACQRFGQGTYDVEAIFGGTRVSSVRIGPGAEVVLSEGGIFDQEVYLNESVANLEAIDFNDEAERLDVVACDPGPGQVALRRHVNLRGQCRVLSEGSYSRTGQGGFRRLDFDGISSVELGGSASACLCVTEFIDLAGSTLRTCTYATATIDNLSVTEVGNDRASFVGVGLSADECATYDAAGDVEAGGEEDSSGRWSAVAVLNCQLSREPLFAWKAAEGEAGFSDAGARDTDFASLDSPSQCTAADGGLVVDLSDGANLVRLVDPVACGAEVDPEGLNRQQYVAALAATEQNDPTRFGCLQLDLPILGGGDTVLPITVE